MPSSLHQTLVDLLRHAPGLVPQLLGTAVGAVRPLDAVLDQLERRVDLAIEVDAVGLGPVAVGVEVQLTIAAAKRRSWPVYGTTLRTARCPRALLVVLTPDPRVARWAARPIDLGPGNEAFRVHVLGPEQIPRVTDREVAGRSPELAMLSALSHADADGDPELIHVALAGLRSLDSTRARSYGSVLFKLLNTKFPGNCEVTMQDADAEVETGESSWIDELEASTLEVTPEMVERAIRFSERYLEEKKRREAARKQGREQGLIEGRREVLDRFLARAGLRPTVEEARRIAECTELARLDRWIDQSIAATSVAEALAER